MELLIGETVNKIARRLKPLLKNPTIYIKLKYPARRKHAEHFYLCTINPPGQHFATVSICTLSNLKWSLTLFFNDPKTGKGLYCSG
jgi:hypothetical protein